MANDCENRIRVFGEPEDVEALADFVKSDDHPFDLDAVVPISTWPHARNGLPIEDIVAAWGTTRNVYCVDHSVDADQAFYSFYTAWQPPVPIVEALRKRFPNVLIQAFFDIPESEEAGYY
ncbi:MAG: hypothetical protein KDK53_19985 [Maritimibacter sp.]|nr:hypothetical protein [Maritimibacter sp.]